MTKDTNQASEDKLELIVARISAGIGGFGKLTCGTRYDGISEEAGTELLKAYIRTEKLKLLNELDKSMPTAEQLATKYGYHMPDKQYGYSLALHDIRETIEAERKKL